VRKRGFTLIEMLVAVVLLGVGIAGVMSGFSRLARTEWQVRESELMMRLATNKLEELTATGDILTDGQTGDFTDEDNPDFHWSTKLEASGVTDLQIATITVTAGASRDARSTSLSTLIYQPPTTGTTQ